MPGSAPPPDAARRALHERDPEPLRPSRSPAAWKPFASATGELGRLDIVINNAGVMLLGPIEGAPLEEWERRVHLNVFGVLALRPASSFWPLLSRPDVPRSGQLPGQLRGIEFPCHGSGRLEIRVACLDARLSSAELWRLLIATAHTPSARRWPVNDWKN